ncbi:MAG: hypothetical protein QGG26_01210 [Candidatus Undinarchaeales archaeon]|nr:hypothetical protein [Candidatus Undinarchaeales archaeon]
MYSLEDTTSNDRPDHITVGLIQGDVPFDRYSPRDESFMDAYQDTISTALEANPDVLVGSEYSFFPHVPLTREEKDERLEQMREISEEHPDTLLLPGTYLWQEGGKLHNTLPVFHKGEIVYSYDKQNSANGENWVAEQHGLEYEAEKSRGVFEHRGLSMGLEICYDHSCYELSGKDVEDLDLQFLVANGKNFIESAAVVRSGGYHVRCDGDEDGYGGVEVNRRVGSDEFDEVSTGQERDLPNDMKLDLYDLDMRRPGSGEDGFSVAGFISRILH